MNKIIRIIAAAAFTLGMSAACTDLSDFEDRIDSLEGRVTALETQIKGLNANIEALQQLVAGGNLRDEDDGQQHHQNQRNLQRIDHDGIVRRLADGYVFHGFGQLHLRPSLAC